jgi:transposase
MKALQRFLPYSGKKPFLRKEQQRYGPVYRMCAHKKFSLFVTMEEKGEYGRATRVGHGREVFRELLAKLPAGSQIALETSGSDCGLVDEMERAGHRPQLAHALTAKRRMEGRHKTDQRDARGWAMLLRSGTLSRVWIRPAELRDQRELLRMRMCLVRMKTHLKNRIHGVLLRISCLMIHRLSRQSRQPLFHEGQDLARRSPAIQRHQQNAGGRELRPVGARD